MVSKAKTKAKTGTGLKILNPKQLLQRLPIALSQVKAGNNSGNKVYLTRSDKLFTLCVNQEKSPKKYAMT